MTQFNANIEVTSDDLYTPEVRAWSLEKYRLVGNYCNIFTTGMRNKWDQLVYIDLFAGAGYSRIKESNKLYFSSALIAMSIPIPFTKYILCEECPDRFSALSSRVKKHFPDLNVSLIHGDSNLLIDDICNEIPAYSKNNTLLPFCFVDPFSLNLHFSTIEKLGRGLMDFLILQALYMDANRNLTKYLKEENGKIALYLGNDNWREDYEKYYSKYPKKFVKFLAEQYIIKMKTIGYIPEKNMRQIRSNDRNLPLYYLSFFTKHPRGIDFFKNVEPYTNAQQELF